MYASAGGSHDYWGGPGYDACRARIGPDFEDVFYKNNWAANVKMHSVYMFYGYAPPSPPFTVLHVEYGAHMVISHRHYHYP